MNAIQAIAYANGAIRNVDGKLIAFFDDETKILTRDGLPNVYGVPSIEIAMEIIGNA